MAALLLYLIAILVVVATLLPVWRTTRWWVRVLDFPRFQVAVLAFVTLALIPIFAWPLSPVDYGLLAAVAAAGAWQLSWVWRYSPLAPLEVGNTSAARDAPECFSLLTTNVYLKARDSNALLKLIYDTDPDLILAVETDEWWCARLSEGLQSKYPHNQIYPLSNGYGIALFSRLELVDPGFRHLVDEQVPSIKTGLRLRCGAVIDVYGVHPQPPAPSQDSTARDTELVMVGREIKRTQRPAVVLGDLNDVAWSRTTTRFKEVGGLLDPRRGRGFFNTYPAGMPGMRYPLDYVFHTSHFAVSRMRVLPRIESDHLPFTATLCLTPEAMQADK